MAGRCGCWAVGLLWGLHCAPPHPCHRTSLPRIPPNHTRPPPQLTGMDSVLPAMGPVPRLPAVSPSALLSLPCPHVPTRRPSASLFPPPGPFPSHSPSRPTLRARLCGRPRRPGPLKMPRDPGPERISLRRGRRVKWWVEVMLGVWRPASPPRRSPGTPLSAMHHPVPPAAPPRPPPAPPRPPAALLAPPPAHRRLHVFDPPCPRHRMRLDLSACLPACLPACPPFHPPLLPSFSPYHTPPQPRSSPSPPPPCSSIPPVATPSPPRLLLLRPSTRCLQSQHAPLTGWV